MLWELIDTREEAVRRLAMIAKTTHYWRGLLLCKTQIKAKARECYSLKNNSIICILKYFEKHDDKFQFLDYIHIEK